MMRTTDGSFRPVSADTVHAAASKATAAHNDAVHSVADGRAPPPGLRQVSASWYRCANDYGVDPSTGAAPRILTLAEIKESRGPIAPLIASARDELDALYKLVRPAGYVLLLTDRTGTVVEHRGEESLADEFKYWGIWLGGVWTERVEGTNGIGTAITEARPISIHTREHFRSRHIGLSCFGAPIYDVDGNLIAILDVSACDPKLSIGTHALAGALTATSARAIEERFF